MNGQHKFSFYSYMYICKLCKCSGSVV